MITEDLVKFLWKYRLFTSVSLKPFRGKEWKSLPRGTLIPTPDPTFSTREVKLDGVLWAGNVEVHTDSSDWERHGHHIDSAYGNVYSTRCYGV